MAHLILISTCKVDESRALVLEKWLAHDLEIWACAFDCWQVKKRLVSPFTVFFHQAICFEYLRFHMQQCSGEFAVLGRG